MEYCSTRSTPGLHGRACVRGAPHWCQHACAFQRTSNPTHVRDSLTVMIRGQRPAWGSTRCLDRSRPDLLPPLPTPLAPGRQSRPMKPLSPPRLPARGQPQQLLLLPPPRPSPHPHPPSYLCPPVLPLSGSQRHHCPFQLASICPTPTSANNTSTTTRTASDATSASASAAAPP